MAKYFGTDGIRGRVGSETINPEFFLKLGWATGVLLRDNGSNTVLIGRDTRRSGYVLQSALQAGLAAAGVDVLTLGEMPTPGVAYLTRALRAVAGFVISASHNLYEDNGIKIFNAEGMKLSDELELAVEANMAGPIVSVGTRELGSVSRLEDARGRYIEFCKSVFPAQLSLAGLKIVIDCAHGATHRVAPMVFHELGADVVVIGNAPDGVNINRGFGATAVAALQEKVLQEKADLGLAFDGDGDRLMMVDERGEVVDGDEVLCILSRDCVTGLRSRAGVVGTLMTNLGLEQALKQRGIGFERTKVGDRFVLEKMLENGWSLGGEASGHIVNLDFTTTGDGIVTALQVLRILCMHKESLSDAKKDMQKRPQILINVPVTQQLNWQETPQIQQAIAQAEQSMGETGRVLLRASGTEACIRVMVEGNDEAVVRSHAETLADVVRRMVD